MHTDKPAQLNGSSFVALRDYFTLWLERLELFYNRRFEDLDTKTTLALSAADKAVTKAEIATEKRFESVNEFRQTLADQATTFMPRSEYNAKHESMQRDLEGLSKEFQSKRESDSNRLQDAKRDTQGWLIPMMVFGALTLINLIINVIPILKR